MSAIIGMWHRDLQPVEPWVLQAMMDPLTFRGPDRSDTWTAGPLALGYHHLAFTPESVNECLPLTHTSGQWTIVADARLDYREELLAKLGRSPSDQTPDGELILLSYLEWGVDCVKHLIGDFAFVIWDADKQHMVCARDHMGVRPFYYHLSEQRFLFASGVKGLLPYPGLSKEWDEGKIAEFLTPNFDDLESTCYQAIRRLPPAHVMIVSAGGMRRWRYWSLDATLEAPAASDEEHAAELRRLFTNAVASRARSVYPVGATLSGGLDSSSNVVIAKTMAGTNFPGLLHTFSAAFPGKDYDESEYFNEVIQQGGLTPHIIDCSRMQPLADMAQAIQLQGEMFYGLNLCIQINVYDEVQRAGVRGLFEGFDGDITISHGFDRIKELMQQRRWRTAWQECHAIANRAGLPPKRILKRWLLPASIPSGVRRLRRALMPAAPIQWDPIINPEFAKRVQLPERLARLQAQNPPAQGVRQQHARSLNQSTFQLVLELIDPTALARGFYPLYPYCDIRLMQFCVSLPSDQKLRDGLTRFVMHHAMHTLPPKVRWRTLKTNPSPIVIDGMHRWHQDFLQQEVLAPAPGAGAYLDLAYTKQAYERYVQNPGMMDAYSLWKAVMLSKWIRTTVQTPM